MIFLQWTAFRDQCDEKYLAMQMIEHSASYDLYAYDSVMEMQTSIVKADPRGDDQEDFEDNYKADCNYPIDPRDNDGSKLARHKITKTGWGLHCHKVELETSKLSSVIDIDKDGIDWGYATIKFYDVNNQELTTQNDIDANCVRTDMSFEPTVDYEIIAGEIWQKSVPVSAMLLNLFHQFSGHEFCTGGFNMEFLPANGYKKMDGRTAKMMPYNATYHTNLLILRCRHSAGVRHRLMLVLEIFIGA